MNLLCALSFWLVAAGEYDPDVDFLTLTTPNFHVIFPRGYENIGMRAAHIAENTLPHLAGRYGYLPSGRTSIILNDQTDFANGSATILPSKVITIYVTAPTEVSGLEDYDDWLSTVITHEMTHIFHLDMAYGLPWVGRLLFGKYVSMNLYNPGWVTEGFAVYEETMSSGSGRGRSAFVDMVVRVAALEGNFPSSDQGYRGYPNWPFSNIAYFLGGRFQLWLAEHYGEQALLHYHRAYASNPIPYFTWLPAMIAFGTSIESLWLAFEIEMTEDAHLALETVASSTMGLTIGERLTRYGGDLLGPRITPDGKHIIFSTSSPVDGARVRRIAIDGSGDEVLVDDTFSKAFSFTSNGEAFYFQQSQINQRFYTHNSILRYDLRDETFDRIKIDTDESGDFLAPSGSLRARDPDVSRDGKRLVFVQTPYGSNRLVLAWIESDGSTIHPKVIVAPEPDVQLSNPRFSPDGRVIAVSRFKGGRRDLVLFDEEGHTILELTRDRAQDIDPTWSADGRWLLFSSDRTGIYNLYAYDLESRVFRQITNLIGGAYQPCVSPDMKVLVYRGYSADGFDVYKIPFEPDKGTLVEFAPQPAEAFDNEARRFPPTLPTAPLPPPPAAFTIAHASVGTNANASTGTSTTTEKLPDGWDLGTYSAFDTILPFHDNWNLFPSLRANEREVYGALSHFGADALGNHRYALSLTYGTFTKFFGGGFSYINDQLEPTFAFLASADAVTYSTADDGTYNERRLSAQATIALPVLLRHIITLSYIVEHRSALDDLPSSATEGALPAGGRYARVQLGYAYSNARSFAHSVSLERGTGFNIALEALSKGLGSDYEEVVLTTEGRGYFTVPWTAPGFTNHVIASRLSLGVSGGPDLAEQFRMGGAAGSSALTTTTENFFPLRGFLTSVFRGTGIVSGSVEYRAPLFRIDRGLGTLPVSLSVLHAAVFADFGRVFDRLDLDAIRHRFLDNFALGTGAELRAEVLLGYSLPLSLRIGYGHAILRPEIHAETRGFDPAANGFYFQLGSNY